MQADRQVKFTQITAELSDQLSLPLCVLQAALGHPGEGALRYLEIGHRLGREEDQ